MLDIRLLAQKLINLRQLRIIGVKIIGVFALVQIGSSFVPNSLAEEVNLISRTSEEEEVIIQSDRQSSDSMGDVFTAYGNVKIIYPRKGIVATSQQVQYLKKEKIIVLTGDVDLIREGRDSIHGQRIVYFLDEDRLVADSVSGSQVLLNFFVNSVNTDQRPSAL